uniref:EF-hand domain-containing protein n=1 Tax=Equus asinus asinus TaxID=83772 RepID=A0A8C4LCU0_EQUAS
SLPDKTTKKCPQHATSNMLAMLDQPQIQEFKEAFDMIDQNKDGFINKKNLHDMLFSLGKHPTDACLNAMINEASGPINFTVLLTMFGEKLNGADSEDVIRNAFARWPKGTIQEDYLRKRLTTTRDQFIDEEVDELVTINKCQLEFQPGTPNSRAYSAGTAVLSL